MRIVVDNGSYHLRNMGDVAMLQVCTTRLGRLLQGAQVHVVTNAPDLLERFCPGAHAVSPVGRDKWCDAGIAFGAIKRRLSGAARGWVRDAEQWLKYTSPRLTTRWRRMRDRAPNSRVHVTRAMAEFVDLVASADLVVATGGGYVTDDFEYMASHVLATLRLAAALDKPTAMFGQGLGPIDSPVLRRAMRMSLRGVTVIGVRETLRGVDLLREAGVPKRAIRATGDDAIELAQSLAPKTLGANIGFNVRNATYASVAAQASATVAATVTDLAREKRTHITPVPISFHGKESDLPATEWALGQAGAQSLITAAPHVQVPSDVIRRAGDCRVVVTGSYHAAVFALAQGVPAVCIAQSRYYQDKFLGLFDQFKAEPRVVSVDTPGWQSSLNDVLHRAWDDADRLRPALLTAAAEQVQRGLAAYESVARAVIERRQRRPLAGPSTAGAAATA